MTPEQLTRFKALFEEARRNLIYSNTIVNEEFHLSKDDLLDETDQTTTEMEQAMRIRLRNREALYIKKIDEALHRIQEGNFGDCLDCGEPIELKRLEARPTTTCCLSCKEEEERRERIHIDGRLSKSEGPSVRYKLA